MSSYSTPAKLYKRIGERLQWQLTAETGETPDDTVAQGALDDAALDINIRLRKRGYAVPVVSPAEVIAELGGLEEQIGFWLLWVRKGFSEDDPAAKAAFAGSERAYKLLDDLELPGVALAPVETDPAKVAGGWTSNTVLYPASNFRPF